MANQESDEKEANRQPGRQGTGTQPRTDAPGRTFGSAEGDEETLDEPLNQKS